MKKTKKIFAIILTCAILILNSIALADPTDPNPKTTAAIMHSNETTAYEKNND